MKIYREFVRGSLAASKGIMPTDDEVAACVSENATMEFQPHQVTILAPWMERFVKDYEAFNRKKRAKAGAAKRWKKKV
jgi:hypothetical protein